MTDKKDDRTEADLVREQHQAEGGGASTNPAATTAPAAQPPATGPSLMLSMKQGDEKVDLGGMRLQGIRVDGEPCAPADVKPAKLKSKDDGTVVVNMTGAPTYAGEETLRSALGGRQGVLMELDVNDGPNLKGCFRVARMDHVGGGADREYSIVLESCSEGDDSE